MTPTCASVRGCLEKAKDRGSSMGPVKSTWRNSVRAALMYRAGDVRVGHGVEPYLKEARGPEGAGAALHRQPVISTVDASARIGGASSTARAITKTGGGTPTMGLVTR
ncbi:hypothetical protein GCM10023335_56940 [Streptomyces siamensis]|uniref:Uncharacterized protein n=1 Tax=Streptomyces siamensis TaxID=1274986 RepID=A0ABP9JA21_9ACTN